jgi:ferrous iron transport protein B
MPAVMNSMSQPSISSMTRSRSSIAACRPTSGLAPALFSLLHNPCSTTIYTIYKETRSAKWTAVATLLPVAMGLVVCFLVAQVWRLLAA